MSCILKRKEKLNKNVCQLCSKTVKRNFKRHVETCKVKSKGQVESTFVRYEKLIKKKICKGKEFDKLKSNSI